MKRWYWYMEAWIGSWCYFLVQYVPGRMQGIPHQNLVIGRHITRRLWEWEKGLWELEPWVK
jgi:hypothetical protein